MGITPGFFLILNPSIPIPAPTVCCLTSPKNKGPKLRRDKKKSTYIPFPYLKRGGVFLSPASKLLRPFPASISLTVRPLLDTSDDVDSDLRRRCYTHLGALAALLMLLVHLVRLLCICPKMAPVWAKFGHPNRPPCVNFTVPHVVRSHASALLPAT
eukprot:gene24579-biopygen10113